MLYVSQVSYLSEMEQILAEAAAIGRRRAGGGGAGVGGAGSSTDAQITTRKSRHAMEEGTLPPPPRKLPRVEQEVGVARKEASGGRRGRRTVKERSQHEGTTETQAKAIYKVYTPIDNGVVKDQPVVPIV